MIDHGQKLTMINHELSLQNDWIIQDVALYHHIKSWSAINGHEPIQLGNDTKEFHLYPIHFAPLFGHRLYILQMMSPLICWNNFQHEKSYLFDDLFSTFSFPPICPEERAVLFYLIGRISVKNTLNVWKEINWLHIFSLIIFSDIAVKPVGVR